MKKLNILDKFIFLLNSLAATMLLLSYLLPYVAPKNFSLISVLSLAVPVLIILNVLFFLYWLLKVKKQFLLSLFVLAIGFKSLTTLYKFSSSKKIEDSNNLTVMSYNVRLFNLYKWISEDKLESKMFDLFKEQQLDILSLQEYKQNDKVNLKGLFPYKYEKVYGKKNKSGQAIFSKFPIVNSGSIEFKNTRNSVIFVDVVKQKDTIRVYNVHLQSLHISKDVEMLNTEDSERIFKSVGGTFKMQQTQTEKFLKHKNACKYPMIVSGDFNNTSYSYVYRKIADNLQDAFSEAGNGFGRTFNFKYFPVRIDYILASTDFTVNGFKTLNVKLSDHFPVVAKLKLN